MCFYISLYLIFTWKPFLNFYIFCHMESLGILQISKAKLFYA